MSITGMGTLFIRARQFLIPRQPPHRLVPGFKGDEELISAINPCTHPWPVPGSEAGINPATGSTDPTALPIKADKSY